MALSDGTTLALPYAGFASLGCTDEDITTLAALLKPANLLKADEVSMFPPRSFLGLSPHLAYCVEFSSLHSSSVAEWTGVQASDGLTLEHVAAQSPSPCCGENLSK